MTLLNGTSLFGRLLPSILADRAGPMNVMIAMSLVCAAIVLAMLGIEQHGVAAVVAVAALYGFFSGAREHRGPF